MIDLVKCFSKVEIYDINFIVIIKGSLYLLYMAKKLCHAALFLSKPVLVPAYQQVYLKVPNQILSHNPLERFYHVRGQGNRSVVGRVRPVSLLVDGSHVLCLECLRYVPTAK